MCRCAGTHAPSWPSSVHHVAAFAAPPSANAATAANRYFFICGIPFRFDDEAFEREPSLSSVTDMALVKAQNLLSSAKNLRSSAKKPPTGLLRGPCAGGREPLGGGLVGPR
jgi:hypothetical protein